MKYKGEIIIAVASAKKTIFLDSSSFYRIIGEI